MRGCRQHNLRGFDLEIPLGRLTVVTGPSGSGKSSLAFHTLYAEGQRRYVETFSPYVRQFFDRMDKPAVDHIDGIPPAIAIEQKNHVRTTRSTVGTLTEINDYLKLLFPRLASGHDPGTGEEIRPDSPDSAAAWALANLAGQTVLITFQVPVPAGSDAAEIFAILKSQGYLRVLIDRQIHRTDEPVPAALRKLPPILHVNQDRFTLSPKNHSRLLEALEAAFTLGKGHAGIVPAELGVPPQDPTSAGAAAPTRAFTTTWTNPRTGFTLRPPTPALFSFNNPLGACPVCRGFGRVIGINLEKAVPDPTLSLAQGAIKPFQGERGDECQRDLLRNCTERRINLHTAWEDLDAATREWIYYGDSKSPALTDLENADELWRAGQWYGVKGFFDWMESKAYKMHVRVFLSRYRSYTTCATCRGQRLQPEALCFRIMGKTLPDLWAMPVSELLPWFSALGPAPDPTLNLVLTELTSRLTYLQDVGLGYLTLDRPTRTLSGGEVERVNLTTCLGASLTNTLFVLDEPTVGLHQRDIHQLVGVMHGLRDKGNTLVVVEHEATVISAADHLIDLGPGAGSCGGQLIYQGSADLLSAGFGVSPQSAASKRGQATTAPASGTLPWLTGERSIPVPATRRQPTTRILSIRGASKHNLRKLDVDIPLGLFVCLTGVSGSGKSTLAREVLHLNLARKFGQEAEGDPAPLRQLLGSQHLSGVELVDQVPLARTPRSTPAVYLGAFEPVRQLFCETEAGQAAALKPGFFSFNSGEGRCDRCAGNGFEKVEMQFLSDLYVTCPDCSGRRYKASTLEYRWHEKSIADILDLTVQDAVAFFTGADDPALRKPARSIRQILTALGPLLEVGLGYLKLGQSLNTLSGGEAQRLKLCQLLATSSNEAQTAARASGTQPKLLILDEPTTGLHFSDIANLLGVFRKLVDAGHTLLVIEHNLDVIKSADWILDLGPDAGEHGGQLVAQGPPEAVAKTNTPTARFLRQALGMPPPKEHRRLAGASTSHHPLSPIHHPQPSISLRGARHHNLKNISLDIPRDRLVVISGLSGSGKSTLAFDILFAEGQRRFLDSMSAYARQFAEQLEKPDIDQLAGLPPTVAIEQRVSQGGGKSTVATVTEVWNFIRLLYSKLGTLVCPDCLVPVEKQSLAAIENTLLAQLRKGPVALFAPLIRARKGYHTEVAEGAAKQGFTRLLVDGKILSTRNFQRLERFKEHDIDVEVAAFGKRSADILPTDCGVPPKSRKAGGTAAKSATSIAPNLQSSIQQALAIGKGLIKLLTPDHRTLLLSTKSSCPCCNRSFEDLDPRLFSFNSPHGWCLTCRGHGRVPKPGNRGAGILPQGLPLDTSRFDSVLAAELDADRSLERMEDVELIECPACHGTRLNPTASIVTLQGTPIAQLSQLSINHAAAHFQTLTFAEDRGKLIARDILPEIRQRLAFLQEVGLGYLQLDRSGNTLSGGEAQRIRLAAQLGSNLRGVLYVLDEPTIGLHPRDNAALLQTLIKLRNQGNSLVIVEHDEDTIAAADHLIDLGPGAGRFGGQVVYQGAVAAVANRHANTRGHAADKLLLAASPTLRALTTIVTHPIHGTRRPVPKSHPCLTLTGCHANNLKHLDAAIPLGRLTVLTGISGSGKSTLMHQCIAAVFNRQAKATPPFNSAAGFENLKACHEVDQSPIGKTSRSCPATYVKVFDHIRALFAQLPEARMRGYEASRFSFNTEGGRCPACNGNGRIKLEMDFLPSTWVHCETCHGDRYNPATLEVTFRHQHIGQVLNLTIDEAAAFFDSQPRIAAPLKLMADTGLGYLQLGQASPTLSGGEAQRIKLVSELTKGRSAKTQIANLKSEISNRRYHGKNLYLIEEPTVGLHREDVQRLIEVLHRLVDEGHTVVVIEHHMAVAAEADWILDLGPEAGEGGGRIVAQGPPEKIIQSKTSRTAPFLRAVLER
ncbi:MAG: excinuclease ABC subunit UvrA [Verrucomicrobia bacterium]|nr:excinuclease ABC subunit UvrA [Verrucomicrobiota bacterium]